MKRKNSVAFYPRNSIKYAKLSDKKSGWQSYLFYNWLENNMMNTKDNYLLASIQNECFPPIERVEVKL